MNRPIASAVHGARHVIFFGLLLIVTTFIALLIVCPTVDRTIDKGVVALVLTGVWLIDWAAYRTRR